MKMPLIVLTLLLLSSNSIFLTSLSAGAKDAYELNQKADDLQSTATQKESKAVGQQSASSTAIDAGDKDDAARHAKKAAKEQEDANKYAEKAQKTRNKAAEKAASQSY